MSVSVLPLLPRSQRFKNRTGQVSLFIFQLARGLFLFGLALLFEISLSILRPVREILKRRVQYLILLPLPFFSASDRKRSWALRSVSRGVRYLQVHYTGGKASVGYSNKEVRLLEQLQLRRARCQELGISARRISAAGWKF